MEKIRRPVAAAHPSRRPPLPVFDLVSVADWGTFVFRYADAFSLRSQYVVMTSFGSSIRFSSPFPAPRCSHEASWFPHAIYLIDHAEAHRSIDPPYDTTILFVFSPFLFAHFLCDFPHVPASSEKNRLVERSAIFFFLSRADSHARTWLRLGGQL